MSRGRARPDFPFALERIVRIALDAPGASVTSGDRTIGAADTVAGSVAHFGGTLMLEGTVRGDVTAVGSEVTLRPGAGIDGNLTVVGGRFYSTTMAEVAGTRIWLREERVTVTETPGRLFVDYEPPRGPSFPIEPKGFAGVVIQDTTASTACRSVLEAGRRERREGRGAARGRAGFRARGRTLAGAGRPPRPAGAGGIRSAPEPTA